MLAAALLNVALVVPPNPKVTMVATSTVADDVLSSLQELAPSESTVNWAKLQELLERTADTPYKD